MKRSLVAAVLDNSATASIAAHRSKAKATAARVYSPAAVPAPHTARHRACRSAWHRPGRPRARGQDLYPFRYRCILVDLAETERGE